MNHISIMRILFNPKYESVRKEYDFLIKSKKSFMSSDNKPFLTLKI